MSSLYKNYIGFIDRSVHYMPFVSFPRRHNMKCYLVPADCSVEDCSERGSSLFVDIDEYVLITAGIDSHPLSFGKMKFWIIN